MAVGVQAGPRASFGQRLAAALIDGVILIVIDFVLRVILGTGVGGGLGLIVWLGYLTYFEGSPSGQTPGKRALGIRVYDFGGGSTTGIGYGRALIRTIARIISGLPCFLGYLWMLWDGEKQTWHDKLAATVVVPTAQYPVGSWPG
jgi:uncharacterized RDD family membrane protein YckC